MSGGATRVPACWVAGAAGVTLLDDEARGQRTVRPPEETPASRTESTSRNGRAESQRRAALDDEGEPESGRRGADDHLPCERWYHRAGPSGPVLDNDTAPRDPARRGPSVRAFVRTTPGVKGGMS
jgi:hypothetical protein